MPLLTKITSTSKSLDHEILVNLFMQIKVNQIMQERLGCGQSREYSLP